MRQPVSSILTISALFALVFTATTNPALAEKKGMNGNYIGVGGGTVSGQGQITVNGRVQLGELPLSIRPSLSYSTEAEDTAFIGTFTYDAPIFKNTNAYVGVGAALNGTNAYSSFAIQGGVETAISKNIVLFGDVTYLTESDELPWKAGIGYRF